MANEYIINFTGSINGLKPSFTIEPRTVDNTTSLTLYGKGAASYGAGLQENLIQLLENFCNIIPPETPTAGQLWFDYTAKLLKVCQGYNNTVSPAVPVWTFAGGATASITAPLNPIQGQIWYDVKSQLLYVYNNGAWYAITSQASNKNTTPLNPTSGVLWYNPDTSVLSVYDGVNWVVMATLADVINNAIIYAIALG